MSVRPFNVRLAFVAALLWMFFAAPAFAQSARAGAQVYADICAACHADGVARAFAAGDMRAARVALAALSALVDDAPDGNAPRVTDLATERRKRRER